MRTSPRPVTRGTVRGAPRAPRALGPLVVVAVSSAWPCSCGGDGGNASTSEFGAEEEDGIASPGGGGGGQSYGRPYIVREMDMGDGGAVVRVNREVVPEGTPFGDAVEVARWKGTSMVR